MSIVYCGVLVTVAGVNSPEVNIRAIVRQRGRPKTGDIRREGGYVHIVSGRPKRTVRGGKEQGDIGEESLGQ